MDRKLRDRTQAAPSKNGFPLFRSAEFDPPHMMYDAAVAIGFAPRTSLSHKSNLRDSNRSEGRNADGGKLFLLLSGVCRQLAGLGFRGRLVEHVFARPDQAQPLARLFLDGAGLSLLQTIHLTL
jgi:hypothetical protein